MKSICKQFTDTAGNVLIEFTLTAVALFIPISYLAVAVTQVASGYIEVQDAARTAVRVLATSTEDATGMNQAKQIATELTNNNPNVHVEIFCSSQPCLVAEEIVTVRISKEVFLDLPSFTGLNSITVTGTQAEIVQES